tara:strand:- start:379 stop:489 length:111 start_codon:yes stop_codon:yes gene_type:complete
VPIAPELPWVLPAIPNEIASINPVLSELANLKLDRK